MKKVILIIIITAFCFCQEIIMIPTQENFPILKFNSHHTRFLVANYKEENSKTISGLFQKIKGSYLLIHPFNKIINQATYKNSRLTLYTQKKKLIYILNKNVLTYKNTTPSKITPPKQKELTVHPLLIPLENIAIIENNFVIYKRNNSFFIATINKNIITSQRKLTKTEDGFRWIIIINNNQKYCYKFINMRWQKDPSLSILTKENITHLSADEIAYLRYCIPAKHGKTYRDQQLNIELNKENWYKPNKEYNDSKLNEIELQNINFLYKREAMLRRESFTKEREYALPRN